MREQLRGSLVGSASEQCFHRRLSRRRWGCDASAPRLQKGAAVGEDCDDGNTRVISCSAHRGPRRVVGIAATHCKLRDAGACPGLALRFGWLTTIQPVDAVRTVKKRSPRSQEDAYVWQAAQLVASTCADPDALLDKLGAYDSQWRQHYVVGKAKELAVAPGRR